MKQYFKIIKWKLKGAPLPPPHGVKINMINKLQNKFHSSTFIESGTFLGDMIHAQKNNFDYLHSIELSKELYQKAYNRFAKNKNIIIHQGDSGVVLKGIIDKLDNQALFWLDGHYSGGETALGEKECPVLEELDSIFGGAILNHIILIDDARLFTGKGDYPSIDEITNIICNYNSAYTITVENDIIIAEPTL